jgi:hypothetical protein
MRTRIVAVIGIGIAFAAVPASAEDGGVKTNAVIDDYHAEGDTVIFSGLLESRKRACERGRNVVVVGRDEQAGNAKRVIGRDRTSRAGRFEVLEDIPFQDDYAYARAKPARLDSGKRCLPDRSPEISTAG